MKLLTLNTHSLIIPEHEAKREIFVDFIAKEQPEVFALQEVNQTAAAPLLAEAPAGYYPCPGNMVLLKADNHAAAVAKMLEARGVHYYWSWLPAKVGYDIYDEGAAVFSRAPITAAENLLPAIQRLLASSESLDQSIAQINGMHKGVLRLGVFNSACVTWLPQLVPQFQLDFPGIDVQIYQGSYADICAWVKNGTAEIGFLSNSSALDLDFEPLYDDELVCIAPASYRPARPGCVSAEELRGQPFVSQLADVDADIQSYFKTNDLRVDSRCYIVDDQSMIAMVACGRGFAIMPELMFKTGTDPHGCQVLRLEPAATRSIGLACLARGALSPAARQFAARARAYAASLRQK